MKQNGDQLKYGKINTTESYFDGQLKSREVSITESFTPSDLMDTHALIFDQTSQLLAKNIAKKNITITLDLQEHRDYTSIKYVHITHIADKT